MGFLSSLIPAAANLVGGLLGDKSREDAGEANLAAQKEFAQHGIRWKVEDAKAAGIHPLYALGANTVSFSPSFVGDSGLASGVAAAGQDIARAVDSTRTEDERIEARLDALKVRNAELQNDLLATQIAKMQAPNPPFPGSETLIDGQGNAVLPVPSKITRTRLGDPSTEAAGAAPAVKEFMNRDGSISVWPSQDAKNAIEDSPYELEHMYRNRLLPAMADSFYDYIYRPYEKVRSKMWVPRERLERR